ncbi:hypothetical protein BABA_09456 [Neobacillus bataviensis LMG 21833]|uniref:Uncharacterized protein n=1 Tax=Neobacillus bataviensis LMG 21833 TaxID=1117379 RepID=K6DAU1_9BACI|nr:hypothetical protein BABA_09456 [Neobacillus bataviensis LMG 21833]
MGGQVNKNPSSHSLEGAHEGTLNKRSLLQHFLNVCRTSIFSHPDYTVGFGITPNPAYKRLAGSGALLQYRRSGISPCPEDRSILNYNFIILKKFPFVK